MGGQKPRFKRELHADITADLTYPHGQVFEPQRSEPHSQMVSFMDRLPGFLERSFLPASEHI